ncbi:conserved hypothetical protein [Talaromyces stipitatus ATCC 10500]|uniref:Uncharacterized protein n=1 Tax=Talaromyces stipitatus (strain ATCC 10500 / CBS 375.48 / QM 6759 / NRRL 1006) TaxID=441959 RepID=B8LZN8_TALSN|nr:uncharacterized protein TSTA_097100 [Talaromyces stipitatus ATCC 10500]EED22461.1 conserved hypothetical protein [Talaromyces stipitatus ATCC 10500]
MDKMTKFSKLTTVLFSEITTGLSRLKLLENFTLQRGLIVALVLTTTHLIIASRLRYARMRYLMRKYPFKTRESFRFMTDQEAFEIQKHILQLEFPFTAVKSFQFALFRTYGIPTISSLLARTTEFSNPATAFKRYADTGVLIGQFMAFEPSSERAHEAIARTRFLHANYRKTGHILEDDMLYTLSLFALEPIRFVETYEWRKLSDLEKCAIGTYWKSLGDALDISYACLPSGSEMTDAKALERKRGFQDGLHWLEEIRVWSHAYEVQNMKPHQKNKQVADKTTDVLIYVLPGFLKLVGTQFVSFIMDDRLRAAIMYDPPYPLFATLFRAILAIRKYFLRYIALPRPYFLRYDLFDYSPDKDGLNYVKIWDAMPFYVKPTIWNRWGPSAWVKRLQGLPLPGDDGDKYFPQGFNTLDVGPRHFQGKGRTQMEQYRSQLVKERRGGCPFH